MALGIAARSKRSASALNVFIGAQNFDNISSEEGPYHSTNGVGLIELRYYFLRSSEAIVSVQFVCSGNVGLVKASLAILFLELIQSSKDSCPV